MNNKLEQMIEKTINMMANKLGCHWIDSKAEFVFGNGKIATVERTYGGQNYKLTFEDEVIYDGHAMNAMRTVAYDLLVLGFENK